MENRSALDLAALTREAELAPADPARWEALDGALEAAGRHAERVQSRLRQSALQAGSPRALDALLTAAQVAAGPLGDAGAARGLLDRALRLAPAEPRLWSARLQLAQTAHDAEGAVEAGERLADLLPAEEAAAALADSALVRALELGDPSGAALALARAVRRAPARTDLADQALSLWLDAGEVGAAAGWAELIAFGSEGKGELLKQLLPTIAARPGKVRTALKLAERWATTDPSSPEAASTLAQLQSRVAAWESEFAGLTADGNGPVLALRRAGLLAEFGQGEEQLGSLGTDLALAAEGGADVAVIVEVAREAGIRFGTARMGLLEPCALAAGTPRHQAVLWGAVAEAALEAGDSGRALQALSLASQLDPTAGALSWRTAETLGAAGRESEAYAVLRRWAQANPKAEGVAEVLIAGAALLAGPLGKVDEARLVVLEALALDGAVGAGRPWVDALFAEGEAEPEQQLAFWKATLELGSPELRAARRLRMVALSRLLEVEAAQRPLWLAEGVALDPTREGWAMALANEPSGGPEESLILSALALLRSRTGLHQAEAATLLATRLEAAGGRALEALAAWRTVLEFDPGQADAQAAVLRLEGAAEAQQARLESLSALLAESTSDETSLGLLAQWVPLALRLNHAPSQVLERAERWLQLAPESLTALEAHVAATRAASAWTLHIESLGELARRTPEASRAEEHVLAAAEVASGPLATPQLARGLLLAHLASHPSALHVAARLASLDGAAPLDAHGVERVARALHSGGRTEEALALVDGALPRFAEDPAALVELAATFELALGRAESALGRRLAQLVRHVDAEAVARLDGFVGEHRLEAQAVDALVSLSGSAPLELDALATRLAQRGGDGARLRAAFERRWQRSPSDGEALLGLLDAHARLEGWEALIDTADAALDGGKVEPVRTSVIERKARALQLAGLPSEAGQLFEELAPGHTDSLRMLEEALRCHESAGDRGAQDRVLVALSAASAAAGDAHAAHRWTLRRARLAAGGDETAAAAQFSALLAERPEDGEARQGLRGLLDGPAGLQAAQALVTALDAAPGDARLKLDALDVVARRDPSTEQRAAAFRRSAELLEGELSQPELAFVRWCEALRVAPTDEAIRARGLASATATDAVAEWAELLSQSVDSDAGRGDVGLLRDAAAAMESSSPDPTRGLPLWRRLATSSPGHLDALRGLHRLERAAEEWPALASTCLSLASASADLAEQRQVLREAGTLQEGVLDAPEAALSTFERLVALDEGDRDALAAVDRLAERLDRPDSRARALELRSRTSTSEAEQRDAEVKLARIERTRLNREEPALERLAAVLSAEPQHATARAELDGWVASGGPLAARAFTVLDPLLQRASEHLRRIQLREKLAAESPVAERAALLGEVRAIQERELGQPDVAFMSACKAFAQGVDRAVLAGELERLGRATASLDEACEVLEDGAAEESDEALALSLRRRSAALRVSLGQVERAIEGWKQVLAKLPGDREALDALTRLYEREKSAQALADLYRRKAQLAESTEERVALLVQCASALDQTGNEAGAEEVLREAVALEPGHVAAWHQLDLLLPRRGNPRGHAEVLSKLAALSEGPQRRGHLVRRAMVLEKEGSAPEALEGFATLLAAFPGDVAAVAGLERLLAEDEVRQDAARVLEPVVRDAGDARRLAELLDVRLIVATPAERAPLLDEIAALREALGQTSVAFALRLRAFREHPENPAAQEELERLAATTGAWEELAAGYQDALDRELPADLEVALWRALARLQAERLGALDQAAASLEEVSRRAPNDTAILEQLARLYRRLTMLRELADVMRRQGLLETEPRKRRELLVELASLYEERLAAPDQAIAHLEAIFDIEPADRMAMLGLHRLYAETERWESLAGLMEREIQIAQLGGRLEESADLLVKLGRLRLQRLGDAKGAFEAFAGVLKERPGHAGAASALEELVRRDGPMRLESALLLDPHFETTGEHARRVQVLDARVQLASGAARLPLLHTIVGLYAGPLGAPEMAFMTATRALREAPGDETSLALAVEHVAKAESHEEFEALLEELIPRAPSVTARIPLLRAQARIRREALNDGAAAADAWMRLLELAPEDDEAIDLLLLLLRDQGEWETLVEVLRRKLGRSTEFVAKSGLLLRIAEVQDERLRDGAGAIATLQKLLAELDPDHLEALQRLDRLLERESRFVELADVITRELVIAEVEADGPAEDELRLRLGQLRETHLHDRMGAIDAYRAVLSRKPDHPGAIERLERALARDPSLAEAADALEGAFRSMGDVARLAALIELRASNATDRLERKRRHVELASLRSERQNRPELAFLALCKAFRDDPADVGLLGALERTSAAAESDEELAALWEGELEAIADPSAAARVAHRLALLLEGRLDREDEALTFHERAIELDPVEGAASLPAVEKALRVGAEWDALVRVLRRVADPMPAGRERAALLCRLAALHAERLGQPDRASEIYEEALTQAPDSLEALKGLEGLYAAAQHWDRLLVVLGRQLEQASGTEREQVLGRMAQVHAGGKRDLGRAIALQREVLETSPRNESALAALEELLGQAGHHEELAQLLEHRLSFTVDPREIVRASLRLGALYAQKLDRPEEAQTALRSVLDREPRHRGALELLETVQARLGRTDDRVATLRRLLALEEEPSSVARGRMGLAEVLAAAGRNDEAIESARRAFEQPPHEEAVLQRAESLLQSLEAWVDAVKATDLRARGAEARGETETAVELLFSLAETNTLKLSRRDVSLAQYERILGLDPKNDVAFSQLRALAQDLGEPRREAAAVDAYAASLPIGPERLGLLRDLAQLQQKELGQRDLAFLTWCRALRDAPSNGSVLAALRESAAETSSWEEMGFVVEEVAEGQGASDIAVRLWVELGRIQDEQLDAAEEAERSFRRALSFDPVHGDALDALAAMHRRRGRDDAYVASLEEKLRTSADVALRRALLLEIAQVHDERLSRPDQAIDALERALLLDTDAATLEQLCTLLRRERRFPELAQQLVRARDLAAHPSDRAALQTQVAELFERELKDEEAAIAGYRQALEFDPRHPPAQSALDRLLARAQRFAEQLALYERQLELATDPAERIRLFSKAAAVAEDRLQDLEGAESRWREVLALDSMHGPALVALDRLDRALGRWDDLVQVIDRRLALTTSAQVEERVELLLAQGDVWHQRLSRVDRAAQVYAEALTLDPGSRRAMHQLGVLYERSGNWPFALDMLSREAEVAPSAEAVELWQRAGRIQEEMLLQVPEARAAYEKALERDPRYLPAIRRLRALAELERDDDAMLAALSREAEATADDADAAEVWVAAGDLVREKKDDREASAALYAKALARNSQSLGAARPLADWHLAHERFAEAQRMLEVVVERLSERAATDRNERPELARQAYRLAFVAEKLGQSTTALKAYRRAHEADATYLPALEGLAQLLFQAGEHAEAAAAFSRIVSDHRDALTDGEVVEVERQLGECHLALGDDAEAARHFERALALEPNHEPSLQALVILSEKLGTWDRALELRKRLVETATGAELIAHHMGIGRLCRDHLHDPFTAIDSFQAALALDPELLEALEARYALLRGTRQLQKASEALQRVAAHPSVKGEVARHKRVLLQLAELHRDDLREDEKAAAYFEQVLDLDPRAVEAFTSIEKIWVAKRQWSKLEGAYAAMIRRLPKGEDTHAARMALWRTMADLYQRVMRNPEAAAMAWEVVAKGSPEDLAVQEKFAELATQVPSAQEKAMATWRRLLPETATPSKAASALARLHATRKEYDAAFLAAQAVVSLLGEGGPEEREILTKLTPYAKRREQPQAVLSDRAWTEKLMHPKARGPVGEVFALIWQQAGASLARKPAQLDLDPKRHRIDLATAEELVVHQTKSMANALGLDSPLELWSPYLSGRRAEPKGAASAHPDQELGLVPQMTWPLSWRAGAAPFKVTSQRELIFSVARSLTWGRPEFALAAMVPAERLEALFQAAMVLVSQKFRHTLDPRLIEPERKLLEKALSEPARATLARIARSYLETETLGDVRAFLEGAELTAARAGLLLSGSVEAAKAQLEKDTGRVRLPLRTRIRDLLVFTLSEELGELRTELGTEVQVVLPSSQART